MSNGQTNKTIIGVGWNIEFENRGDQNEIKPSSPQNRSFIDVKLESKLLNVKG